MKVTAFNGSPRIGGNTQQAAEIVLKEIEKEGIETELVNIGAKTFSGCMACFRCRETKDKKCALKDDGMNSYIMKMDSSDGIIIASPVYYGNVTTAAKALMERCGQVSRANDNMLKDKIGAPVVAVRRGGANFTYAAINFFFGILSMPIAASTYWNTAVGRDPGDIMNDEEGKATLADLGKNMARLIKMTRG